MPPSAPPGDKEDSAAVRSVPMERLPLLLLALPLAAGKSALMDKGLVLPCASLVTLAICFSRAAASCSPETRMEKCEETDNWWFKCGHA